MLEMSEACVCHLHTNAESGRSCTITINDVVAKRVKHDVPIQDMHPSAALQSLASSPLCRP